MFLQYKWLTAYESQLKLVYNFAETALQQIRGDNES